MKIAARRRLAVGVVATTSAMLAGVLIAPSSTAAPNGLTISPNFVPNTDNSEVITFTTTDADLNFGGQAVFTRVGTSASFTESIAAPQTPTPGGDRMQSEQIDFTDVGNGLGGDGPADRGIYNVTVNGNPGPAPGTGGGGSDSCVSCFTVSEVGTLAVSSVAPPSLKPGTQGDVSVLGNAFERGARLDVLFPGTESVDSQINPNNAPFGSDTTPDNDKITTRTELRRRFNVLSGAVAGSRDVRVTLLDGTAARCTDCFFVAGADLTSVNPTGDFNNPDQGTTRITFSGPTIASNGVPRLEYVANPQNASRSQLSIVGTNVEQTSSSITADFDLRNAAPGANAYQPFVQGDNGVVNACQDNCRFTVRQADARTPTLTSLDRSSDAEIQRNLRQGETATFLASGTNFSKGATVIVDGGDVTVTAVEYSQDLLPNQFLVTLAAAPAARTGDRSVTARLTDGKVSPACNACLTVTPSGATASPGASTSASPSASASTSSSPTPLASPGPRDDARYAGLASPVRVLDTRSNRGARRSGEIVLDLSQRITDQNATAAVLNVTVTNPTRRGFLVAYPNGTTKPGTSNVNFDANQTQANEVVVGLSSTRRVSLFVDSAEAHVVVDLVGFFTTTTSTDTGRVTTNTPSRALDSRTTDTPRRTGEVIVNLSDRLPSGATSAILNVTVQGPSARGFVVVYPTGTDRPRTSNVNFERGQTQANEVVTRVGTGSNAGRVSLFIDSATTALIVDVVGAVTPGATAGSQVYTPLERPARAADTRSDRGSRRSGAFDVAMPSSVPSNATGVVLNVTATNGTRSGFVTVYPAGQSNPGTSNVNFPGERAATANRPASAGTQANEVITRLGNNRSVTLFVGGRDGVASHVIVDVVGYLTGTGAPAASSAPAASGSPTPRPSVTCTPGLLPTQSCPSSSPSPTGSAAPTASPTTATASVSPTATTTAVPSASASAAR